ncbi:MAG: DUF2513 domain-containing protein [Dehalococcoidia bacterium]|nr:DUF2513 domain-containing protein [Dehalococcoidia bacterium]
MGMKRYMQLIRAILQYVECHGNGQSMCQPEIDGYTPAQVSYHIELCKQAGYIWADGPFPQTLTWAGHNALDDLRKGGSVH